MKLYNKQLNKLEKNNWDLVQNKQGNVHTVKIFKEDGKVFNEICEILKLSAYSSIELAVIATKEDIENENN